LSTKSWVVAALAWISAVLVTIGAVRIAQKAPTATRLAIPSDPKLFRGGKDILVIGAKGAIRIDAHLDVRRPLVFPELTIVEVESMAEVEKKIALTVKAYDHDPDTTFPAVLLIDDEKIVDEDDLPERISLLWRPGSDVKRAHISNVRRAQAEEGEPPRTVFAVYIQEDDRVYRLPIFDAGRDADEDRHRIEVWFRAWAVEKIVWPENEGPLFLCSTERRHLDEKMAPVMPTVAIDLKGLDHDKPLDEELPLVVPNTPTPKIDLSLVASRVDTNDFEAVPLGTNWLWLGDSQAIMTDANGHRLDRKSKLQSFLDDANAGWIAVAIILLINAILLPFTLLRALRAAAVARERAFFGMLKVPGGAALDTDKRGNVTVTPGACVRIDGYDVELGPGLTRADDRHEVPLIDGDPVFVLGRAQGDDAGPWRSSGRRRLVPDGTRYSIGRGAPETFAEEVTRRPERWVLRQALSILVIAIFLLLRFGSLAFG
jgi:hypothetical protein